MPSNRYYATGRRKATAQVWISPGTGNISVNGKELDTYFVRPVLRLILQQPFGATEAEGKFDVMCTVRGGGKSGQAGAIRHGIAALATADEDYRPVLKKAGMLTRDARAVERKKYGRHGARKRFQFSALIFIFVSSTKAAFTGRHTRGRQSDRGAFGGEVESAIFILVLILFVRRCLDDISIFISIVSVPTGRLFFHMASLAF